jgi:rhodanese-related sulfurtransferase
MTDVPRITPQELKDRLEHGDSVSVFDVRTRESRESGAIVPGSDHLDVNAEIKAGNPEILLSMDLPKDETIVIACNTGGKSSRAAQTLREHGYDAVVLDGGMTAWTESSDD